MSKVYVVKPDNYGVEDMFFQRNWRITPDMEDADLVVFCGGEDISPTLYHAERHPLTWPNDERDKHEVAEYKKARSMGIPMAGICRGAQLINVLRGGNMWQHIEEHYDADHILNWLGEEYTLNSYHHQAMRVGCEVKEVYPLTSRVRAFMAEEDIGYLLPEINEVIVYDKALCIQAHPEFSHGDDDTERLFFNMLRHYFQLEA